MTLPPTELPMKREDVREGDADRKDIGTGARTTAEVASLMKFTNSPTLLSRFQETVISQATVNQEKVRTEVMRLEPALGLFPTQSAESDHRLAPCET